MIPLFQACNASVFDKIIFVLTSATTHNSSYSFELKLFIKTLKLHFLIFFHVTIFYQHSIKRKVTEYASTNTGRGDALTWNRN